MPESLKTAASKRRRGRPPKAKPQSSQSSASTTSTKSTATTSAINAPVKQDSSKLAIPTVPGLMEFTPDKIESELPKYEDSKFRVDDPLNPIER